MLALPVFLFFKLCPRRLIRCYSARRIIRNSVTVMNTSSKELTILLHRRCWSTFALLATLRYITYATDPFLRSSCGSIESLWGLAGTSSCPAGLSTDVWFQLIFRFCCGSLPSFWGAEWCCETRLLPPTQPPLKCACVRA